MRKIVLAVLALSLAGCASQILQGYVGKDVTEAAMDYGPPVGTMDLPDGRRAFMWKVTTGMATPVTTTYSGYQNAGWISGTATTTGGFSSWECVYTLIGQKNRQGSYTVVDYRKPSLSCE